MIKIIPTTTLLAALSLTTVCFSQATSWYKTFAASIDKIPITIQLHKVAGEYTGYYYYNKQQQPFYVSGDDTAAGHGQIRLVAYLPGDMETYELFRLAIDNDRLTGEWQQTAASKVLPVSGVIDTNARSFDMIFTEGELKLRTSLPESPAATYHHSSIWPRDNSATSAFLKRVIDEQFGTKNSTQDIGKLMLAEKKEFFDGYLADNKTTTDSDILAFPSAYILDEYEALHVMYQTPKLLTLAQSSYSFTGGAHGNFGSSYTCVDLQANHVIKLSQVVTASGTKRLNTLLAKYFRRQYKLKPTDSLSDGGLFEDKIEINGNFYLTGKGIGFSYNPYEIGPYVMGEIDIFIPFSELTGALQPGFLKLIN